MELSRGHRIGLDTCILELLPENLVRQLKLLDRIQERVHFVDIGLCSAALQVPVPPLQFAILFYSFFLHVLSWTQATKNKESQRQSG